MHTTMHTTYATNFAKRKAKTQQKSKPNQTKNQARTPNPKRNKKQKKTKKNKQRQRQAKDLQAFSKDVLESVVGPLQAFYTDSCLAFELCAQEKAKLVTSQRTLHASIDNQRTECAKVWATLVSAHKETIATESELRSKVK